MRGGPVLPWGAWILLLASLPQPCMGQDVQVSATVSSDTVGLQDQLRLTIMVSGGDAGAASPPVLQRLPGFQIVQGPDTSTQFQWINGKTTSSKNFSYLLVPEREGQIAIDPIEIRVGAKAFKTQAFKIRVIPGSSGGQAGPQQRRPAPFSLDDDQEQETRSRISETDIFVRAEIDRTSAYIGQQVTLAYRLYTKIPITGLQLQDNPALTGFWVEGIDVPTNPTAERKVIDGEEYLEYLVKKQALFPTVGGPLKIPPSSFAISARSSNDLFSFFRRTETVYRKTKEARLDVKQLPTTNRPADFGNAVGTFNLTSSLDKTEVAVGDAVSLRVKLEGRGNLKLVPDLTLPQIPDFTVYSSKRSDNIRRFEEDRVGGDKIWEYVLVPKAPGAQSLPSLSFSYFNPEREKYETITTLRLSLSVKRGAQSGSSLTGLSGIGKQDLVRQGTDINFIKLSAGDFRPDPRPVYGQSWFYALAVLPMLVNLVIFFYQKGRDTAADNPRLARSRRARRLAIAALRHAEQRGRVEPRHFYDGAASALSRYLSDRFFLPEIAVTADSLERALAQKSVPSPVVNEAVSCLQECDFARFAAKTASAASMSALAVRIRKVIDGLERT
jgi:hypothetical protein